MNEITSATIYGVVQGITEFLPVSSSGHLALIPFFTGSKDPGVVFDLAMHVGTAIAVMVAFRDQLLTLLGQSLGMLRGENAPFAKNYWIATIATIALALCFKDFAAGPAREPIYIAINLVVFGAIMWWSDFNKKSGFSLIRSNDWKRALLMGVAQSLAVFPGVSRSGITLTAGRFSGMSRADAGAFSFMLSLPIILGGFVFKLLEMMSHHQTPVFDFSTLAIGVSIAFIVGFITIKFFMSMLGKFGLGVYFWYRLVLAGIIIYFRNKV